MEKTTQIDSIQLELNKKARRKDITTMVLPYVGLIFVVVLFTVITQGNFVSGSNLENLVNQCFQITIVAVGAAFIYAAGMMDMSVGSVACVSMLAMGILMRDYQVNALLAIAVGMVVAVFCTAFNAMIHNLLRVPIFVVSLCTMNVCNGIAAWATEKSEIFIDYQLYNNFNSSGFKILVLVIVIVVGYFLFNYTRLGKELKAVGGNETAAKMSGVVRWKVVLLAFIVLGCCLGLSSFFSLCRAGKADAASGTNIMTNILVAIVLGGFSLSGGAKARFFGPIIGALMITALLNGLTLMGLDGAYGNFAKGLLFIIVVGLTYERTKYVS